MTPSEMLAIFFGVVTMIALGASGVFFTAGKYMQAIYAVLIADVMVRLSEWLSFDQFIESRPRINPPPEKDEE